MLEDEIQLTSTASLRPPLDETALIQRLVAQYLSHEGYVGTVAIFTREVRAEATSLSRLHHSQLELDHPEDSDSVLRQRKRMGRERTPPPLSFRLSVASME